MSTARLFALLLALTALAPDARADEDEFKSDDFGLLARAGARLGDGWGPGELSLLVGPSGNHNFLGLGPTAHLVGVPDGPNAIAYGVATELMVALPRFEWFRVFWRASLLYVPISNSPFDAGDSISSGVAGLWYSVGTGAGLFLDFDDVELGLAWTSDYVPGPLEGRQGLTLVAQF